MRKAFKDIKIGDNMWFVDFNYMIVGGLVYGMDKARQCFGVVWDDGIISTALTVEGSWDNSVRGRCATNYEAAQKIFYKDVSQRNMYLRR